MNYFYKYDYKRIAGPEIALSIYQWGMGRIGVGGLERLAGVASRMKKVSTKVLIILVTTASQKEAVRIGEEMVNAKLAACANVIPKIQSIYRWKEKTVKAREALLILKSTELGYHALEKAIKATHTYETPEIMALSVKEGLDQYLAWVRRETRI